MKDLMNDLKTGEFRHVYLLFGDENYLKLQYRDRLIAALISDNDQMNLNRYDGDHVDEGALIDQAETLPFFAKRRVITVDRSGFFNKSGNDRLVDYLKELPDYLYLIFTEQEVDKRGRMFKAVKNAGRAVEFGEQKETTLQAWMLKMLAAEKLKIRKAEMDHFLEKTGTDMNHIRLEADKLIHYCLENEIEIITMEVIDEIVTERVENRIFDMVTAVSAHKRQTAMELYADLLALKEPPMRILYLIGRQFHQLLMVKELSESGLAVNAISQKAGMPPFVVRKNLEQVKSYSVKKLKSCINACVEAEANVKTGMMGDRLAVELILIRLSSQ